MKKMFALFITVMMVLTLVACGGKTDPTPSGSSGTTDPGTSEQMPSNTTPSDSENDVSNTTKPNETKFSGTFAYNPPADNFCFEVKTTENGKSTNISFAKIGNEEAKIDESNDWQQFANISTGAYYTVVDGDWYEDVSWGFYSFEETGGLGDPFDSFNEFFELLGRLGFGNEKLKDFYVGDETFLGIKCWVFDTNGYNSIYAKYWVDPSNGCTLKKAGTTTDIAIEVTKYNLNYTVWNSQFLPN